MTRSLAGTSVLVTGATSGIGWATANLLLEAGADVTATGRRAERLAQLKEENGQEHLETVQGDLAVPIASREVVDAALARWNRLDSVVVAAGVGLYGSILDYSDDELQSMIDSNFSSTLWTLRACLPHLVENGGDVVVVASVAGLRGGAQEAVYAATKFAQVGLAAAVDREVRPHGVRVSTICPASVATEFAVGTGRTEEQVRKIGASTWLQPSDVAEAILFTLQQPRRLRTTQMTLWAAAEES